MILTLDIQKKTEPIIRQVNNGLHGDISGIPQGLSENLGDLILSVEGFDNHIFALSKAAIKDLSDQTNKTIAIFVDIDEKMNAASTEEDKEIVERFKYSLKALFKLKSLLHLAYTKDVAIKKTHDSVKEGLSAISRAAVLHNLSKRAR